MRIAEVTAFGSPATVQERPIPHPGHGQVLVRLEACGLCHTDIHAMRGDWPVKPTLPLVPGHEGVGIIEELGEGVTTRTVGQRVAMPWLGHACGDCRYCVDGRENLCERQYNNGYAVAGGYGEYMLADARFATPVPDEVTPVDAAPLTCASVTTYAAIKNAHVTPGETVTIFGVGGLGHLAVQYARLVGAKSSPSTSPMRSSSSPRNSALTTSSTPEARTRSPPSGTWAVPTSAWCWRSHPLSSVRRSTRSTAAAGSCWCRCRRVAS